MAALSSVIDASEPNKSSLDETQATEITVNFGIFFDGTKNQRLQILIGKEYRKRKDIKEGEGQKARIERTLQELHLELDEDFFKKTGSLRLKNIAKNSPAPLFIQQELDDYNNKYGGAISEDEYSTMTKFTLDGVSSHLIEKTKGKELSEDDLNELYDRYGRKKNDKRAEMQDDDFTNIARMEPFYYPFCNGETDYAYKIYVTGSGTFAKLNESSSNIGLGFGQSDSGVVQKVDDALNAIEKVTAKIKANNSIERVKYVFNLFGFSRGATEARLFVDLCSSIREKERNKNHVLKTMIAKFNKRFGTWSSNKTRKIVFPKQESGETIEFPFIGIFDTVSSVGVNKHSIWNPKLTIVGKIGEGLSIAASKRHQKNVDDLGLNTCVKESKVKRIVHICALDEYRENFSLISVPKDKKVEQFFLPGAHADIGGGYASGNNTILIATHDPCGNKLYIPAISRPGNKLANDEVLEVNTQTLTKLKWIDDKNCISDERMIITEKHSLSGYSYLPMHLLIEKIGANLFKGISGKYVIPSRLPKDFSSLASAWSGMLSAMGACYYPGASSNITYEELRKDYLHFSSSVEQGVMGSIVNGPNFTATDQKFLYYDRYFDSPPEQNSYSDPLTFMKIRGMQYSNSFGMVRHYNDDSPKPHQGIDYYAPIGTPFYAVKEGTVVFVGSMGDYGKCVILKFDGLESGALYAHVSKIYVKKDEKVHKGQALGLTGNTGNANSMKGENLHLHFEYRKGPEIVNLGKGLVGRGDPNEIVETQFVRDPENNALVIRKT